MAVISALRDTAGFFGEKIVAHPGAAGGATAMAVAMTFFTANAVYFQEREHPAALFATRPEQVQTATPQKPAQRQPERQVVAAPAPEASRFAEQAPEMTRAPIVIPDNPPIPVRRPDLSAVAGQIEMAAAQVEQPDQKLAGIQELLHKLGYYEGAIDGMRGPVTDAAVEAYKQKAGLRGIELSEAELMTSLRNNLGVTAAIPERRPAARPAPVAPEAPDVVKNLISGAIDESEMLPERIPSAEVVKVQAALRAFGNTDIVVDGVSGGRTETAIREFQALFHLPVTGEIDGTLLDKMRAVGLIH